MALGEVNRFEKSRQDKPYNEILAGLSKKNKPGYRVPKYASSCSNNIRLSGLDTSDNRTLGRIFIEISNNIKGAELLEKEHTDDATTNSIVVDFRGIEGEVDIKVVYVGGSMLIYKTYTEKGESKSETEEVPVRLDYPQTTIDSVCSIINSLMLGA